MSAVIRKIVTVVEETHIEMGKTIAPPTRRAAAIAVIENPFAGRYVEDLSPLIAIGEELGELLSKRAVAALGIDGARAQSYGKAAAVGENGELEHAAAILHPKMGAPVRKVLTKGAALIPSSKKRSGPGTTLDIPLEPGDSCFVHRGGDKEAALALQAALRELPEEQREVVSMRVWSGMTLDEIATATGAPLNTVASRYRYALEKLRERLKPYQKLEEER